MNKLLKTVRSSINKDDIIKKSIIKQLSNSVKELQYSGVEENKSLKAVDITEAATQLCTIVEALFLHGLKDSLTHRFRRALADIDERPDPNFWAPLLVISHRQIIDQITSLSLITTEIGQCRAWIRLALNDFLLSSYLMTMRQDSSALKHFYRVGAFVRDLELLEVAQKLIEGVESFKSVNLPCNSSLLNKWTLPSLYLSGIWAPTLKTCPVAPCDDVAQSIEEQINIPNFDNLSDTCSLSSAISITSLGSGLRQVVALDEDEALRTILAKHKSESLNLDASDERKSPMQLSEGSEKKMSDEASSVNGNLGNSLNRATGWSFDESEEDKEVKPVSQPINFNRNSLEAKYSEASFNDLIESYHLLSGDYIRTPNLREVWKKIDDIHLEEPSNNNESEVNSDVLSDLSPERKISKSLAMQVGRISKEKGLDSQNFECLGCKQPFDFTKMKPNVCEFTGEYYCDTCMSVELMPIAARIIHNWDFKPYPVSQKSFNYINEVKDQPMIDFKVFNPFIYGAVEEMSELQTLRHQLNYLRAYLYTCREPIIGELQKMIREYMYEHIHQYSITDLLDVPHGVLAGTLQKVVDFGREHVTTCWLCSQKGFLCEVCKNPKALFPFDFEHVYRCNECNAVYHKTCLSSEKPCPKCERRKKKIDNPAVNAIVE